MSWIFLVAIFILSCFALSRLASRVVRDLVQIAQFLRWREFIIAFFVMAIASSLPDFFINVSAAMQGKPELAFGDIIGNNLVDLTLVLAIAVFFSKKGLSAQSSMVQKSALFTTAIAILPLFLIFDGNLNRIDGVILILSFFCYCAWIFSEKDHFKKTYKATGQQLILGFKGFLKNIFSIAALLVLLLVVSQVVVSSAQFFADKLGISLALVGILIVGLGNAFPEIYFSAISAKKEQNWLVLGDLMGSVIVASTLILGLIATVIPFEIKDFSPFLIARIFLIAAALLSLWFIKTGKKITKKEGLILLGVYIAFLIVEIFAH